MISDKEKKYTLNEYLRNISHIQDKEYQIRVWIHNEGPECQAFDDAVCDFFDIGDPILESYKEFGITETQYHLLKNFRDKFEAFSDINSWPPEFIDTPEWKEIMSMAKETLKALHYKQNKKIDIKQILFSFLETIEGISDKDYQTRIWIRGEGPEVDSFDETTCHFFDAGDPILESYKEFGITETQYHLLKNFRDKFEAFSDINSWPPEFIDTPEWKEIMDMAKEVLKAFHYKT